MATKSERKKEIEEEYQRLLAEADEDTELDEDEDNPDDDVVILKGNAAKEFMEHLKKMGYTPKEVKEKLEEVNEEAEEIIEEKKSPAKAAAKKATASVDPTDPPRPAQHRFFGGGK